MATSKWGRPPGLPKRAKLADSSLRSVGLPAYTSERSSESRSHKPTRRRSKGSALLTVLWVSAALAAVGFALANTVRGETERASTSLDELRSYYLATGGLDRAAVEVLWSNYSPGNPKIKKGATWVDYPFPTGAAHVEFIPETAKFDVNHVPLDRLSRLLTAMGLEPARIQAILTGVDAWRSGRGALFSSLTGPTFPASGTSFQEIEELLAVRGVTPELFYGTYVPATDEPQPGMPRLVRRSGLIDCLSVYGTNNQIDANTADPAVLFALGMPEAGIRAVVAQRSIAPLDGNRLATLTPLLGPAGPMLRVDGNSIVTIRSTGRVRLPNGQLSDLKRTVAAVVKYMPPDYDSFIHILRWYDVAWTN